MENIRNDELIMKIEHLRDTIKEQGNFSKTELNGVIGTAIRGTYYSIAKISKTTELVKGKDGRLSFKESEKYGLMLLADKNGKVCIPLYTSLDVVEAARNRTKERGQIVVMRFSDAAYLCEEDPVISKVVIDPDTLGYYFTKGQIQSIRRNLIKQIEKDSPSQTFTQS